MAQKALIQIRRGLEANIGTLAVGELGYCTDTNKLYIGSTSGNVLLVAAQTAGDMLKSIYDTNNNGKVDAAELADSVPWTGVSGKPTTFAPSMHTHTVLSASADNYKDALALPSTYDRGITIFFSNNPANKFNSVPYCTVMTIKGYSNMAVTQYIYPYNADAPISYRYALYNTDAWLSWKTLSTTDHDHNANYMSKGPITWDQLKGV